MAAYREALRLKPEYPQVHNNLGLLLGELGRIEEAIASYQQAVLHDPRGASARVNLGSALAQQGRLTEAAAVFRSTLEDHPHLAEAHLGLGNLLLRQDRADEAIAAYHQALVAKPGFPEAENNLGVALSGKKQLDEAIAAHRRALDLNSQYSDAANNLGNALKDTGDIEGALEAYRRALAIDPNQPDVHSNLIYALHLQPADRGQAILDEQQRWNQLFCPPRRLARQPHPNDPSPHRRLRIGYVSPDFRHHAVAFFFTPLLEAHDRERFEIFCYSDAEHADSVTERLRKSADAWRDVRYLSELQLADLIRGEGIDILVDLAMHTADNRLPAFARRPAPVQVAWLAYPGSTGMETMDYRFTDERIDPRDDQEEQWGETLIRLPDCWCCYDPIAEFPPVSPLPAARNGYVTFGALNQFAKASEDLLGNWAALLQRVPESRLLMSCPDGTARERTLRIFAVHSIAPERLQLVAHSPWPDYVRLLEGIDIGLDTYPCNGMTTTCHTLWMGVPVVTCSGAHRVSRAGISLLQTIGLDEWIASSAEEYISLAAKWAGDFQALAELRATLRARMQASPLMNAPQFARNIEASYRRMWKRWCAEKQRVFTGDS
jgi:predicted O-linked N-acetylglucosamine transferase (SPINDLY family)